MTQESSTLAQQVPPAVTNVLNRGLALHGAHEYHVAAGTYFTVPNVLDTLDARSGQPAVSLPVRRYAQGEGLRGRAAALGQVGTLSHINDAIFDAETSLRFQGQISDELLPAGADQRRASHGIFGRLLLQKTLRKRWLFSEVGAEDEKNVDKALGHLQMALDPNVEPPVSPQMTINFSWLEALAKLWQGDQTSAKELARNAIRIGWESEAKGAPSSNPDLSPAMRLKAKLRAVARPIGVLAAATIATPVKPAELKTKAPDVPDSTRTKAALFISEALFVGPRKLHRLRVQGQ